MGLGMSGFVSYVLLPIFFLGYSFRGRALEGGLEDKGDESWKAELESLARAVSFLCEVADVSLPAPSWDLGASPGPAGAIRQLQLLHINLGTAD